MATDLEEVTTEEEVTSEAAEETTSPADNLPAGMFGRDTEPAGNDDDTETLEESSDDEKSVAEESEEVEGGVEESAEPAVEDSGEQEPPSLSELAEAFGVDPADYDTPEELLKMVRLMDKQGKLPAKSKQEEEPEPKPTEEKPDAKATEQQPASELSLDIEALKNEGYDDSDPVIQIAEKYNGLVAKLATMESAQSQFEQLSNRLESFEQAESQRQEKLFFESFHSAIDALNDDRFGRAYDKQGRPQNISKEEQAFREKLFEEFQRIDHAEAGLGRELNVNQLVRRAQLQLDPEYFKKQLRREVVKQGVKQSKQKLGSPTGSRNVTSSIASPMDKQTKAHQELLDYMEQIRSR